MADMLWAVQDYTRDLQNPGIRDKLILNYTQLAKELHSGPVFHHDHAAKDFARLTSFFERSGNGAGCFDDGGGEVMMGRVGE